MMSKKLGVALALLLSATSVTFATGQPNTAPATFGASHRAMHPRRLYNYAPSGMEENAPNAIGPVAAPGGERAAAIEACSAKANKWSSSAWQTTQLAVYRTCMSEHGQTG